MIRISVISSLYQCERYLSNFLKHVSFIDNPEEVEVLLLHNAPTKKEINIIKNFLPHYPWVKHVIIPRRENLYSTWNRGVKMAQGEYCAIWNVDDIRTPDSLRIQAKALDTNPKAAISYGNFIATKKYGDTFGKEIKDFDSNLFPKKTKTDHLIGCFPMWRKNIHEKIGYFDEQFRLVSDFDFQIRASYSYPFIKVEAVLGYFLHGEGGEKRLSQNSNLQATERTALGLRYNIVENINIVYYYKAHNNYLVKEITSFGKKSTISRYIPNYSSIFSHRKNYAKLIVKIPYQYAKYIKHHLLQ